jgi:hypothetical protein
MKAPDGLGGAVQVELQEGTVRTVEAGLHRRCVPLAIVASLAAALWAPPALAQSISDLGTLISYGPGGSSGAFLASAAGNGTA